MGNAVEGAAPPAQACSDKQLDEHAKGGKRSSGRHETIAHHGSTASRRTDAKADIRASYSIEHPVDTLGLKCSCKVIEVAGGIVDGGGAQLAHR